MIDSSFLADSTWLYLSAEQCLFWQRPWESNGRWNPMGIRTLSEEKWTGVIDRDRSIDRLIDRINVADLQPDSREKWERQPLHSWNRIHAQIHFFSFIALGCQLFSSFLKQVPGRKHTQHSAQNHCEPWKHIAYLHHIATIYGCQERIGKRLRGRLASACHLRTYAAPHRPTWVGRVQTFPVQVRASSCFESIVAQGLRERFV